MTEAMCSGIDAQGQPTVVQYVWMETVYDDLGRAVWMLDAKSVNPSQAEVAGVGTHTTYDKLGRVTLTERYDGIAIRLTGGGDEYAAAVAKDENNKLITGTLLSKTETHYDDVGQVDYTVSATGAKTAYAYDKLGRQTHVTVDDGTYAVTTETRYDAAGRAVKVSAASDVLGKDAQGQPTVVQSVWTETEYDADGRAVATLHADGTATQVTYDAEGRKASETDALGRVTAFGYDDKSGRLTSVTQPEVPDHLGVKTSPVTKYGYDPYGNLTSITDALGRVTTFTFNAYGQQTSRVLPFDDPAERVFETKTYDGFGNLDTSFDYTLDAQGKPVGVRFADYRYDYDLQPAPAVVLGQQVELRMGKDAQSAPAEVESYTNDNHGRRSKVVNGPAETAYGYDNDGRLKTVGRKENASLQWAIAYAYDDTTGRHTSTVTAHSKIDYGYDPFGRLLKVGSRSSADGVTWSAKREATYGYTPAGKVQTVTVPEADGWDLVSAYAYDAKRPWVSGLTHQRRKVDQGLEQVSPLAEYHYQRAGDGQIRKVVESVGLPDLAGFQIGAATYDYDALNRLTRESYDLLSAGAGDYTKSYVLDIVGNRRRLLEMLDGGPVREYVSVYDQRDRLEVRYELGQDGLGKAAALAPTFYEYLPTGEQQRETTYLETITIPPGGGAIAEPTAGTVTREQKSTWDYRGRLLQAEVLDASTTTTVVYAYDPDGVRVREEQAGAGSPGVRVHVPDTVNPTGYTQTIDELADQVFAQATLRVATASHSFGHSPLSRTHFGYDEFGDPDAGKTVAAAYLMEMHSGVRQMVTDAGAVAASYQYDAFGVTVASVFGGTATMQDAAAANRLQYRGERLLAAPAVYDLRTRPYQPETARFLIGDPRQAPVGDVGNLNPYVYAWADGVNKEDPSGLFFTLGGLGLGMDMSSSLRGTHASSSAAQARNLSQAIRAVSKFVRGADRAWDWVNTAREIFDLFAFDPGDLVQIATQLAGALRQPLRFGKTIPLPSGIIRKLDTIMGPFRQLLHTPTASEWIGVIGTAMVARALRIESTAVGTTANTGIDGIMRVPHGPFVILEAKGGDSRLRNGQMRDPWIGQNLERLRLQYGSQEPSFARAVRSRQSMVAMVVKLNLNVNQPYLAVAVRGYPGINSSWGCPWE
jgi:RHS repeat-associated protein